MNLQDAIHVLIAYNAAHPRAPQYLVKCDRENVHEVRRMLVVLDANPLDIDILIEYCNIRLGIVALWWNDYDLAYLEELRQEEKEAERLRMDEYNRMLHAGLIIEMDGTIAGEEPKGCRYIPDDYWDDDWDLGL